MCCTILLRAGRGAVGAFVLGLVWFVLGGLCAPSLFGQAPTTEKTDSETELPTAEIVFADFVKAAGGREAMETLDNVTLKGEFSMQGVKGPITLSRARPNKLRVTIDLGTLGKVDQGTDGEVAWSVAPMQGARLLEGKEKDAMIRSAYFDDDLHPEKVFKSMKCLGTKEVAGTKCFEVECTYPDDTVEKRYFDADTHLLIQSQAKRPSPLGEVSVTTQFSDYRNAGKIKLPFRQEISSVGQSQVLQYSEAMTNQDLAEGVFASPVKESKEEEPGGQAEKSS